MATETDAIQKKAIRPLSISGNILKILTYFISYFKFTIKIETEVHDRYEKEEKIKRDATAGLTII